MATEDYWLQRRKFLLNPEIGPLRRLPMDEKALIGFGPMMAIGDALDFLVLGMPEHATQCLEFVPRLRQRLSDPSIFAGEPEHRQRESAAHLRQYLHLGSWLLTGNMREDLAQDAYSYLLSLNQWWGKRFTEPNLHDLMLLSIEAREFETAIRLYLDHERRPLRLPPSDIRFSANPRAVLYVCLVGKGILDPSMTVQVLDAFRKRASRWERSVRPIPYVGHVDLARTLRACNLLLGLDHQVPTIVSLIK